MKRLFWIMPLVLVVAGSCNRATGFQQQLAGETDTAIGLHNANAEPGPGASNWHFTRLEHYEAGKGNLLATFKKSGEGEPSFPIYQSTDDGRNWSLLSNVTDTKNHFGMRSQPQLFEVPEDLPGLRAGTVLCSGSSVPKDKYPAELLLYKSEDGGKRWEYLASVVKADGENPASALAMQEPTNGSNAQEQHQVWEALLEVDSTGRLVCYYSDESRQNKGRKPLLAHKTSVDGGKTWSDAEMDSDAGRSKRVLAAMRNAGEW